MRLLLLVCGVAAAQWLPPARPAAPACPGGCVCAEGPDVRLECGDLTVDGQRNYYVNVACESALNISCATFPRYDFGSQQTLPQMSVTRCSGAPRCLLDALSARALRNLTLRDLEGGVDAEMFRGVEELYRLVIMTSEVSVAPDSFSNMTALRSLTLTGVPLTQPSLTSLIWPESLTVLEVSYAGLTTLPARVFSRAKDLEALALFLNKFENIDDDAFEGLSKLWRLDMASCNMSSLPARALRRLTALQELNLSHNRFTEVAQLPPLQHLRLLRLSMNQASVSFAPLALSSLPALADLKIESNVITSLPPDLLHGSPSLTSIDLSQNRLRELPEELFRDQVKLETLKLNGNQLKVLPDKLFLTLTSMTNLDLSQNKIESISEYVFDGTSALLQLSLSYNQLRRLPHDPFRGARALQVIDLANNKLVNKVPMAWGSSYEDLQRISPFGRLSDLERLDLSHNELLEPLPDVRQLVHLSWLDYSYNNISVLGWPDDILLLNDEATVNLTHNRVEKCYLNRIPREIPSGEDTRKRVVLLDDNSFDCDCALYQLALRIRGARPLKGGVSEPRFEVGEATCAAPAHLKGSRLRTVPLEEYMCVVETCPANCTCVVRPHTRAAELTCARQPAEYTDLTDEDLNIGLGLDHYELKLTETPDLLSLPESVTKLNLSGLGFREVPPGISSSLDFLDLSNNELILPPLELLQGNMTLRMAKNPISCDCWNKKYIDAIIDHRDRFDDFDEMTCEDGVEIWKLNPDQLCDTFYAAVVGGTLAMLGLLIALAAALLYWYSLEVKVFLYTRGLCACWVNEEDLDKDKTYDAFVSFSHEDEEFVRDNILPGLEQGPYPFKLCVHYRDWIPGEWIPAQISRSVDESRRTIVVVSRNFLDSIWGRLEFRAAHMSAVKESRSRVIVVLLDDVTGHPAMDAELRAYLATNTYLKWGDPWFWERLRYALPHRKEEARIRQGGIKLMMKTLNGKSQGGLDTRLTPDGKIINAANKVSNDLVKNDFKNNDFMNKGLMINKDLVLNKDLLEKGDPCQISIIKMPEDKLKPVPAITGAPAPLHAA